jgi:hypothetical protein
MALKQFDPKNIDNNREPVTEIANINVVPSHIKQ